jgi:hypothetical protein
LANKAMAPATCTPSTGCPLLLICGWTLNWVSIWFHLGNQFGRKLGLIHR